MNGWVRFCASADNLTLLGDAGDFFALVGGANPWRLLELRVFQRGSTTLAMEVLRIHRGTVDASGGGTPTEYEFTTGDVAATVDAQTLPTTDVGTDTLVQYLGWNTLQEAVWLPPPAQVISCKIGDNIGVGKQTTTAHTGVGVLAVWEEFIG